MTEGHTKLSYDELKSVAQNRLKWRHHYQDLPTHAENYKKKNVAICQFVNFIVSH